MNDKKEKNIKEKIEQKEVLSGKVDSAEELILEESLEPTPVIEKQDEEVPVAASCGCCIPKLAFDKKTLKVCAASAIVSIICAFVVVKIGMSANDDKIQKIADQQVSETNKIKTIGDSITSLEASVEAIKGEVTTNKESSAYIYKSIASFQNDIDAIKKEFHMKDSDTADKTTSKLSAEKADFIDSLGNLIKDGAPFDSFLDSYATKIDIKKYATSEDLLKFSTIQVKSIDSIQKDFATVGLSSFEVVLNEGFWERQKRIITEKIVGAVKFKKTDEKGAEAISEDMDDKTLFSKASEFLYDGKVGEALNALEKIKTENKDLGQLISDVKSRADLENAFSAFKKEFVELEENK